MNKILKSLYLNVASDFAMNHLTKLLKNYKATLYNNQNVLGQVVPNSDINLEYMSISPIIKEVCILTYWYITNSLDKIDIINSIMNIEKENIKINKSTENSNDHSILIKIMSNIIKFSISYCGITDTLDDKNARFYTYALSEKMNNQLEDYLRLNIIPHCMEKQLYFDFDYEFFNNPVSSSIIRAHSDYTNYNDDFDYAFSTLKGIYNVIRFIKNRSNKYDLIINRIIETEPILSYLMKKITKLESINFYPENSEISEDLLYGQKTEPLIYIDIRYIDTVPRSNLSIPNSVELDIGILTSADIDTIFSIGVYRKNSQFIINSGVVLDEEKLHIEKKEWIINESHLEKDNCDFNPILDEIVDFFEDKWNTYWYDKTLENRNSICDQARSYISRFINSQDQDEECFSYDLYDTYDTTEYDEQKEDIELTNDLSENVNHSKEKDKLKPTELFDKYYYEAQSKSMSTDEALKYAIDKCIDNYGDSK